MDESIFTKLFSYRERENHSPLENFLTESLSFCLAEDSKFRKDFFSQILEINYNDEEIKISTQEIYAGYGRPDIEINFENTCIIFECKVGAIERENQLSDYASLLIKEKINKNKHLVYLTKYYEHKELPQKNINFHLKRWFEVYNIIDETNSDITKQFKKFLKEKEMENLKNFTVNDMLALNTIPETISKMEELLQGFKTEFLKKFKSFNREKDLKNFYYTCSATINYKSKVYYIILGFYWGYEGYEIPYFGLFIRFPKKKFENSDVINIFKRELVQKCKWEFEENEMGFEKLKPLSDFIMGEEDCIPAMKRYAYENLETIYSLMKKYPDLFKK